MTWVAAGTAVVSLAGSVYGASQTSKAAKQQQAAARAGQATAGNTYNQIRQDWQPYATAGGQGLNMLMQGIGNGTDGDLTRRFSMSDYQADPGYEFRRTEGMRGIEGSAAARGGLLSGGALKSLDKYNSGQASQEYGNAYNRYSQDQSNRFSRLMGITGIGQGATGAMSAAGSHYGDQVTGLQTGAGNAAAAGTIGQANAWSQGLSGVAQAGQQYQMNELLSKIYSGGNMASGGQRKPGGAPSNVWNGAYATGEDMN